MLSKFLVISAVLFSVSPSFAAFVACGEGGRDDLQGALQSLNAQLSAAGKSGFTVLSTPTIASSQERNTVVCVTASQPEPVNCTTETPTAQTKHSHDY